MPRADDGGDDNPDKLESPAAHWHLGTRGTDGRTDGRTVCVPSLKSELVYSGRKGRVLLLHHSWTIGFLLASLLPPSLRFGPCLFIHYVISMFSTRALSVENQYRRGAALRPGALPPPGQIPICAKLSVHLHSGRRCKQKMILFVQLL